MSHQSEPAYIKSTDLDVIDLSSLFASILYRKKVILIFTATCILITGIINFFILKPAYQAIAVVAPASISSLATPKEYSLIISDTDGKSVLDSSSKMSFNMDQIVKLSQVDVEGYKEILISNDILYRTITTLGLDTTVSKLKDNIIVTKSGTNIIEIKVSDQNPEMSAKLTNTLVSEANNKLTEINSEKMVTLSISLDEQLKLAQSDLAKTYSLSTETDIEKKILNDEIRRKQTLIESLNSKILELRIAKSLSVAEDRIIVLSPAFTPEKSIGPQKIRNIAASAIFGFLFAVLGVGLYEYLKCSLLLNKNHII